MNIELTEPQVNILLNVLNTSTHTGVTVLDMAALIKTILDQANKAVEESKEPKVSSVEGQ